MKAFTHFFFIALFAISACNKPGYHDTPPEQMSFTIIDKTGASMIHSPKDNVVITYSDNNVTHTVTLSIVKLPTSLTDTTASPKYNGLFITDKFQMSDLSARDPNPVHTFNLSLNGVNIGVIYLDYWGYQAAYPKLSSPALTFNGVPVTEDRTVSAISSISAGSNLNLLQMQ